MWKSTDHYRDRITEARSQLADFFDTLDEEDPVDLLDLRKLRLVDQVLEEIFNDLQGREMKDGSEVH